ncbi:GTPase Era, mitochondrial [Colletes gigas]|uniref:GTPase Era, mitochondrial n=1 Tax=Colletes gigas TaxID=935657 RepID=UPI001C9B526B|nr:GTPase Era, mitochondrial [Colletes gigas]
MLLFIKKCTFQSNLYFCKRLFSCSTARKEKYNNEYILDSNQTLVLRREDAKFLKVAIVGLPNNGKSTLINQLTKRTVCPTSSKVHTTMHKFETVYSENDTQIVFMDTPGLTAPHEMKKYNLAKTFKNDPAESIAEADVIGILQDVTNIFTRVKISDIILDCLKSKRDDASLLLILNKVDKLKKKVTLLEIINQLTNKSLLKFDDIFMVSALTGDGVDDLRNYLLDSAKINDWQYEKDAFTDQSLETVIEETVRAKLLDHLNQEIPYNIKTKLEHFDISEDGTISAVVLLKCNKKRNVFCLLKQKGQPLKTIAMAVEKELRNAFRTHVIVRLSVETDQPKEEQAK